ncbi:hypothetical protein GYMLUDRAFT_614876 [Collybiopsis luxurians FD-317 M1]|uniref:Major facilitator superfamily (MFS) profile domain-containing protein n=1 Tax=Collybiopsis luxurians FD-317 M1 TaxID=944289 RepID=A0A0D0CNB3_9AGAR|nr:hypothetical protein GYMLUDRAFT_614876 [Collybiopsis luxurians FD-317 M1]
MDESSSHYTAQPMRTMDEVGNNVVDLDTSAFPPPIPTVLAVENSCTPLPILPMSVLAITMLGEFLSSNVSVPFLLLMVKGFGFSDEAEAAFWTGILVAMFFLSQFLTSLLWATLADKYGRRSVLVATLLGSAVSVTAFGLSKSITQAICVRLIQGIFAGAVGVARGSVVFITDSSNEGRAYAILGFCWGFGGLLGPIIGGSLERPTERLAIFRHWKILQTFPYLLPSAAAGLILLSGSILACFLERDGGSRTKPLSPHPEKTEIYSSNAGEPAISPSTGPYPQSLNGFIRGHRVVGHGLQSTVFPSAPPPTALRSQGIPIGNRTNTMSSSGPGSLGRTAGSLSRQALTNPSPVFPANISGSLPTIRDYAACKDDVNNVNDLADSRSIAERMVLVNENAVNNIADLWVAAALNLDRNPTDGDVFEINAREECSVEDNGPRGRPSSRLITRPPTRLASRRSNHTLSASRHRSSSRLSTVIPTIAPLDNFSAVSQSFELAFASRQLSSTFFNSELVTPRAVNENQTSQSEVDPISTSERELSPIPETRRPSELHLEQLESTPLLASQKAPTEIQSTCQLPLLVIAQFGLLALHTTAHDQVFLSYLTSGYEAGGLGLTAGDFAQLIALMGVAQIFYQFYLYPNVGPPRGRLSHATMYRLGTCLFIPAYLTVVMYRNPFAHPDDFQKFALITALTISTAVRYCGMTFAFTSISVLLNLMAHPEAVGYANGLAQTIVSLARCVGPILGGWVSCSAPFSSSRS